MPEYADTLAPGRIDIIVFPSGGKEVLGRQPSYPALPEAAYLPEVRAFVATKQGLDKPQKATGYYSCKGGVVAMTWTPYAGPMPQEAPVDEPAEETPEDVQDETGEAPETPASEPAEEQEASA